MRILCIPDTQIRRGVNIDHLEWLANYVRDKRFDALIQLGDWFDMKSLSSYDRGKRASHNTYIQDDFDAGNTGLERFEKPLAGIARTYSPKKIWIPGNHDGFEPGTRIHRHLEEYPNLAKTITPACQHWEKYGWERGKFLQPRRVSGVCFVHYCALNADGTVSNGKHGCKAEAQGKRFMMSTVSGHRQGLDIKYIYTPTKIITSVVAGSFYGHDEGYLTLQGKKYWKGVVVLNDVRSNGEFDVMPVSLSFLRRKYG